MIRDSSCDCPLRKQIEAVVSEQGWNETIVLDFALRYIQGCRHTDKTFLEFLRLIAAEENSHKVIDQAVVQATERLIASDPDSPKNSEDVICDHCSKYGETPIVYGSELCPCKEIEKEDKNSGSGVDKPNKIE